jgi:UDP-N-acetylmuramoylalanine--D-glutamate ligase
MQILNPTSNPHAVVAGLGKTGASCVRYLLQQGMRVSATDSRSSPPGLASLGSMAERIEIRLGGFDLSLLQGASQLLMSPGISLKEPIAVQARALGIEVLGDIELFARAVRAPVVGVTGTNGKSTVTTLLAEMALADGRKVLAGGNLGEPALDLLQRDAADLYVLELSSFQLETTSSLRLLGGVVLNVTSDHMDRYASMREYADAKARIFAGAATAVLNIDDPLVAAMRAQDKPTITYSIERQDADFTLMTRGDTRLIARRGEPLLDIAELKINGLHNASNALAALALGETAALGRAAMISTLQSFPGLPHRSQWVADVNGVRYVDDSKGTNVGATLAAVAGSLSPLVVIAGGDGKNQDFSPLAAAFARKDGGARKVREAVLIGRDARLMAAALRGVCPLRFAASMPEAVQFASMAARPGDTVLLSPACSSLDMFRDYAHRGDVFAQAVRDLPGGTT